MKNIISYIAVLASLLVLGSCQKEIAQPELENPVGELEYETVTFDVAAPSGAQTKTSYGETVTFTPELMVAVYLKNQIGEKTEAKYLQNVTPEITRKSNTETEWTVSVSLVKNFTYDIVFWAQKKDSDYYDINWENATITAYYTVAANDVTRDAFYFLCENYNYSDHKKDIVPYEIELSRPFAQINLGASDYAALVELYKFVEKDGSDLKTRIKTASASVPSVLNVLSGVAGTPKEVEFAPAYTTPQDGSYNLVDNYIKVTGTDATGAEVTKSYTLVGTNYIFANVAQDENPTVDFTLTFEYNDQSFDIEVPNVPYARNYQTNILGNFFTSDTKFNVVIKPGFNNPDEYVDENGNKIEQTKNEFAVKFPATTIPAEGGDVIFNVTGNVAWTVEVTGRATVSQKSGKDEAAVTIKFPKNEDAEDVDYTVSVTTEAEVAQKKFEATYTQAAAEIVTPEEPEPVTTKVVMKDLGYANSTKVTDVEVDDNVTLSFAKGNASTDPAYYSSSNAVRLYQNGATLKVNANGKTIKSIKITFAENQWYIAPDSGEFTAEGTERTWTGAAESVLFTTTGTDKNHRAYVSAIEVTYE